ncbi:MFS general substrate transporter [Lophium mytilinum]|uniref:MFS general substrate transporter n=1 Tax=Lophium mytilinum TaxID=390894 RepID=A0A6A6QHH5_9PEZI|nr:MFS general substrate transporter [Lophium mytilinum]
MDDDHQLAFDNGKNASSTAYDGPRPHNYKDSLSPIETSSTDVDEESTWKSTRFRWFVIFVLSFSGDGWSYEASVISSVLNMPQFIAHMGYADTGVLPHTANILVGPIYSLGQLVGGLVAGWQADRFGRKSTLWTGTVLVLFSTSLLIWAPDVGVLIFARIVQGMAIGFLILGFQIYTAEVANQRERGFLSGTSLISGCIFSTIAAAVAYGVTYSSGNWGWRLALAISYIPSVILFFMLPFIPESPRYYYAKGEEKKSQETFIRYHGTDSGRMTKRAELEYEGMKAALAYDREAKNTGWSAFYNTKVARKRTFIALSSQLIWPWAGQSAWTYYFGRMYTYANITDVHTQFGINLALTVAQIFAAIGGSYLLDRMGRRPAFLIGIGQAIIFLFIQFILAIKFFDTNSNNKAAGAAFVSCYFISQTFWVMFFSPVVYLYVCEIFAGPTRARGFAIGNVISMLGGFIALVSSQPTFDSLKGYTWLLFAGIETVLFINIFFMYPETKGKTLEEIETVLGSEAGASFAHHVAEVRAEEHMD